MKLEVVVGGHLLAIVAVLVGSSLSAVVPLIDTDRPAMASAPIIKRQILMKIPDSEKFLYKNPPGVDHPKGYPNIQNFYTKRCQLEAWTTFQGAPEFRRADWQPEDEKPNTSPREDAQSVFLFPMSEQQNDEDYLPTRLHDYATEAPICWSFRGNTAKWANSISAFRVSGYCECEFFDSQNCENSLFKAFNRVDSDLASHGPHNDRIESIMCRWEKHPEYFNYCRLDFEDEDKNKHWKHDVLFGGTDAFDTQTGYSPCRNLRTYDGNVADPNPVKLKIIEVHGCTCSFYTSDNCSGDEIFWAGNAGSVKREEKNNNDVRSYRCFLPWGIRKGDRSDRNLWRDSTNLNADGTFQKVPVPYNFGY
ncbi:hypothetical protein ABW20_dc0106164 [Dactylellina cionopaga]|nr:hypothetical protein ABW20_dc0106164 [Dactylellina cionopaga]